ncbi:MAG: tRNA preQ1(34) S-adenosylmethionine ribosyltransferase-isomerase QueA [Gemmatimonadota bacterium]
MEVLDYALPPDRIAQHPTAARDGARLLLVDRAAGEWRDRVFRDLPDALAPGDCLVVNDTQVIPARLAARRASGGLVELLLARPLDADAPDEAPGREWEALVRPGRRARPGDELQLLERDGAPAAEARVRILERLPAGGRRIRLEVGGAPWDWIVAHGRLPLPPYIARDAAPADWERYQTVYARRRGAVAAPTAGLHFTAAVFDQLAARGIRRTALTLHVGPGTFRPVTTERIEDHVMDAEWYRVPPEAAATLAATRAAGGRIVAVGTTTVRALETAAADWADGPAAAAGWTDLFIRPGHRFRWTDALVTNFHLPRSTLLLLVAAFAGVELTRSAYAHAVTTGYRFYSYGDAMLIQ